MSKYWGKQIFTHGRIPEVGQKQKTEKKKKEKREKEERTHGARKPPGPKCEICNVVIDKTDVSLKFSGEAKSKCCQCDGWFHKRSMGRHIERKHSIPMSVSCDLCGKVFSSNINLKEHYRRDHGLSTRAKY